MVPDCWGFDQYLPVRVSGNLLWGCSGLLLVEVFCTTDGESVDRWCGGIGERGRGVILGFENSVV
jgi:hypothetical protein